MSAPCKGPGCAPKTSAEQRAPRRRKVDLLWLDKDMVLEDVTSLLCQNRR